MSIDATAFAATAHVNVSIRADAEPEEFLLWIAREGVARWEIGFYEDGEWFERDGLSIKPLAIVPLPPAPD